MKTAEAAIGVPSIMIRTINFTDFAQVRLYKKVFNLEDLRLVSIQRLVIAVLIGV